MAKKKKEKGIPLPILILIYSVLLYATLNSVFVLTLGVFGETTMGKVDSYGNVIDNSKAEVNRSRTISKGYWFTVNGKRYRGFVVYSSDEAWPSLKNGKTRPERIRYLEIFPYINKPDMLADFDEMGEGGIIYHIFAPIGCTLLFLLVFRTTRKGRKKRSRKRTLPPSPKTNPEPQNIETRRDPVMFCPNCGSKLPENATFCSDCGEKILSFNLGVCTSCGAQLPEDAAFCIDCGAAVNSSTAMSANSLTE